MKKLRLLGIWFIPVLIIPLIWPAYSLSAGQFNEWLGGLIFQGTERQDRGLIFAFNVLWEIDPLFAIAWCSWENDCSLSERIFFCVVVYSVSCSYSLRRLGNPFSLDNALPSIMYCSRLSHSKSSKYHSRSRSS